MSDRPEPILYLDDHHGIHIPKCFAECDHSLLFGVSDEDLAVLAAGPDGEAYWDAWSDVCDHAFVPLIGAHGNPLHDYRAEMEIARDADREGRAADRDRVLAQIPGLVRYTLHQDGALWLIPEGMSWNDDAERWVHDAPTDAERTEFRDGYVACALWCGVVSDDPEATDSVYGMEREDLTESANAQLVGDADAFLENEYHDLQASELSMDQAGHDFWLTRNRHGAGFWERAAPHSREHRACERLTKASHAYGEMHLILDDNGQVGVM